jgi:hypothetical protein
MRLSPPEAARAPSNCFPVSSCACPNCDEIRMNDLGPKKVQQKGLVFIRFGLLYDIILHIDLNQP